MHLLLTRELEESLEGFQRGGGHSLPAAQCLLDDWLLEVPLMQREAHLWMPLAWLINHSERHNVNPPEQEMRDLQR